MSEFTSRIVLTWQVETITHFLAVTERVNLWSISSIQYYNMHSPHRYVPSQPCARLGWSLVSMGGISMSCRAQGSLHVRSFDQQELLQLYPNRPTETGNTSSGKSITGNRQLYKTNYCSSNNNNLDQEKDSRNQSGKLFDSFKQKLYKVSTRLLTP